MKNDKTQRLLSFMKNVANILFNNKEINKYK